MSLPYMLRLFCLVAVVTGLVHAILQAAIAVKARGILRLLGPLSARARERALYLIQTAPLAAALLFVGACCIPEYLRNEPDSGTEGVSRLCLVLAAMALAWFGSSLLRGLRMMLRTARLRQALRPSESVQSVSEGTLPMLMVEEPKHLVALVGLFRPVILISQDMAETLHGRALAVALDHEKSHARQWDNWKLLSLSFLPRLPLTGGRWMQLWQEAAEWAADEDAVGSDSSRRLLLAETLVRVARRASLPEPALIQTALSCAAANLETRVMRLLREPLSDEANPGTRRRSRSLFLLLGVLLIACLGIALAFSPWIYAASESLLHLG